MVQRDDVVRDYTLPYHAFGLTHHTQRISSEDELPPASMLRPIASLSWASTSVSWASRSTLYRRTAGITASLMWTTGHERSHPHRPKVLVDFTRCLGRIAGANRAHAEILRD